MCHSHGPQWNANYPRLHKISVLRAGLQGARQVQSLLMQNLETEVETGMEQKCKKYTYVCIESGVHACVAQS